MLDGHCLWGAITFRLESHIFVAGKGHCCQCADDPQQRP